MKILDPIQIRKDFPIYSSIDKPFIYFDNAATTQRPTVVLNKLNNYYTQYNANVHRAVYAIGEKATQAYEGAREKIASFIEIFSEAIGRFFVRNTFLSNCLSRISFTIHPADLINKEPKKKRVKKKK